MIKEIKNETIEKMDKALASLKYELNSLRAGRANPKILDRVSVDYYGAMTPVNQLANVSAPEPRMIIVQPWDTNALPLIEKAIQKSDLGLNPGNDGKIIRIVMPQLTEERRKDLVKTAKKFGEDCKVAIRNIRRHAIQQLKELEKEGMITEDELKQAEADVQKMTDEETKKVDQTIAAKNEEILEV
ncbi:ribosome recycling factor [Alkalibacter saccharofermentans DSM 14828]|uniref:Ribosome-recycling factor n=1 Tax=Alkalibacter saccharofermentans DSM 14828 TaxID=1120975 RepID=A0A1M4S681_9FIRM|nr:ribosome recycling factor [Alkalibacter saccharofermentans]SHE27716.1 ribosome recycling factor [Alkalibacter saccharofermentans DSM 14828]